MNDPEPCRAPLVLVHPGFPLPLCVVKGAAAEQGANARESDLIPAGRLVIIRPDRIPGGPLWHP